MARRPIANSVRRKCLRREAAAVVTLSAATVAEDAALGTVIGAFSRAVTLTNDAGKFMTVGANLVLSGVLDYESATAHTVMIDNGQQFTVTVAAPAEPLPGGTPADDGTFDQPVTATTISGSVKLAGKKAAGSSGKFIFDTGPLLPGRKYTTQLDPDFSLLAQQGKLAYTGFGFKVGNSFHLVGLKGDGGSGLRVYQISGANFNGTSGHTFTNVKAATHGTQAGPTWQQLEVSADGKTYTYRTSANGTDWVV